MASEMSSQFNRDDIEVLIDSIGDWEMHGNQEYNIAQMIKNIPMPDEDHPQYDVVREAKEHFRRREKLIIQQRADRQEKAVFIRAKLFLTRREVNVNQVFDMAADFSDAPLTPQVEEELVSTPDVDSAPKSLSKEAEDYKKRLELAEFFIKDLGVDANYRAYLDGLQESSSKS
jgi:hypothetical protein